MHYSPQVALLEAVLGFMLFLFFLHHSWRYDRLASLKLWEFNSSRDVFKKVMTLCYLFALPSFGIAGSIMAWIKYQVGVLPASEGGMPVLFLFWPEKFTKFINPLSLVETLVWFFDLVVHHQELTFWFWLVRATPSSPPWFSSGWFKFFLVGCVAYAALFATLLKLYLSDPIVLERNVDVSYSTLTIAESLAFANIFWVFPKFIRNAKSQGGTHEVLGRLLSFHELNKIRIAARMMFGCCLFALGMDAFTEKQLLNTNPVILDTLLFISVICNVASALLTLLVFMPRAILKEHGLETIRTVHQTAAPTGSPPPMPVIIEHGDGVARADVIDFEFAPPPVPPSPGPDGVQIIGRPSQALPRPRPQRPHRAQQSEDFDVAEPYEYGDDQESYYRRNRTVSDMSSTKEVLEMRQQNGSHGAPFATLEYQPDGSMAKVPTLNRLRADDLSRRGIRLNPAISFYRSPIDMMEAAQNYRAPTHPSNMA